MIEAQFNWTAIKKVRNKYYPDEYVYDMYEWNLFKMKWVRLTSASGFSDFENGARCALMRSNEIQAMFDQNKNPPKPIT